MSLNKVFHLASLRFFILLRQKLGWLSLALGFILVVLSFLLANNSFINPQKIYWDFTLGAHFVVLILLTLYLATQIFHDECQRRTFHLMMSAGLSKIEWLLGNSLGVLAILTLMNLIFFTFEVAVAHLFFPAPYWEMPLKSLIALNLEILILYYLAFYFSLILRPLLALVFSLVIVFFAHSADNVLRILTDSQMQRSFDPKMRLWIEWIYKILPPFDWFDLKVLVGYSDDFSISKMAILFVVAGLWSLFFVSLSLLKMQRTDY